MTTTTVDAVRRQPDPLLLALISIRQSRRLSQAEISKRMGVTPSALSQYESGIRNPSMSRLRAYADALGVDLAVRCPDHQARWLRDDFVLRCPCGAVLAGLLDECREPVCVSVSLDEDRWFETRSPA